MKKITKYIGASFAAILLLGAMTSCGGNDGKPLSDYPDATTGDSMLYNYGMMQAAEYEQLAVNDTNLRSPEQREAFLKGVRDGMAAIGDNPAYNRGLRLGARMGVHLRRFEDRYEVDLNDEMLLSSLHYGLRDSVKINPSLAKKEFYRLLGGMRLKRRETLRATSRKSLIEEARSMNLAKISDELYYRIEKKGSGPYATPGDLIYIAVDYRYADGSDLGMPTPEMVKVGAPGTAAVMNQIYTRLNEGASAIFATTAQALFGSRTEILGVSPSDVVIIHITLNNIEQDGSFDFVDDD